MIKKTEGVSLRYYPDVGPDETRAEVPMGGTRPENELLLCCARTHMNSERAERVRALLREDIDWAYMIRIALWHRVTPLLYRNLQTTCPDAVPKDTMDQLRSYFYGNARRNLLLTEELVKLLKLFEAHGIPAIPLKGPVLAASVYGNLGLREFSDLDILVRRQNACRARDLLISLGYRHCGPKFQLTDAQEAAYLQSQHHYKFVRDDRSVVVELHWRITRKYFSLPLDYERLWEGLEPVSLAGRTVLNLSQEDLLLILCVHGSMHRWSRLGWICDISEMIHVSQGIDWERVMKQARALGSERILFLGLFLAKDLLHVPLPKEIVHQVEADPVMRKLAEQVRQRLFQGPDGAPGLLELSLFNLKARERLQDRIRYLVRFVLTTTPEDWQLLPLPDLLFPLYYLLRPNRLMGKYGLALVRRIYHGNIAR